MQGGEGRAEGGEGSVLHDSHKEFRCTGGTDATSGLARAIACAFEWDQSCLSAAHYVERPQPELQA